MKDLRSLLTLKVRFGITSHNISHNISTGNWKVKYELDLGFRNVLSLWALEVLRHVCSPPLPVEGPFFMVGHLVIALAQIGSV